MQSDADSVAPRARRRRALLTVARSLAVSTALVVGYFVLPLTSSLAVDTAVELLVGLAVLAVLLVWQVREILRSPFPAMQAIGALSMALTLFLTLFSTTYYLMGRSQTEAFSEPMTRLDSLYFTVTMFATVGFGDITAVSEEARAVAIVQMIGGLVLVGLIARVILGAVQEGRNRQHRSDPR